MSPKVSAIRVLLRRPDPPRFRKTRFSEIRTTHRREQCTAHLSEQKRTRCDERCTAQKTELSTGRSLSGQPRRLPAKRVVLLSHTGREGEPGAFLPWLG